MNHFPFEFEIRRAGLEAFYPMDAYLVVRDALETTQKLRKKGELGGSSDQDQSAEPPHASENLNDSPSKVGHVTGRELLEGFRHHVLKEFGPMSHYVLSEWGIHCCEDVGKIVYHLIDAGIFGKSKEDRIDDFASIYDFEETFLKPYRTHHEISKPAETLNSTPKSKKNGTKALT